MLLAMLKANPDAFIEGNVNLIKAGATLRMPSASEAAAIPSSEARQTVLSQARDFAEYSRRLAGSALVVASKNTREMSGKVSAEAPREEEKAPAQDKLTLSKPLIEGGVAEAKIAKDQEIKDTSTQLAALTKNLEDLEKLAQTTSPTAGDASNVPAPAPAPAAAAAAAAAAAPQTNLMTSAPGPETAPPATRVDSNMSFLEEIQQDQRIWAWGAALMAAIVLFIFWLRRSAKPTEEVYAPSYSDHLSDQFDPSATPKSFASTSGIPDQMSSIDLNLSPKEPVMDNTPLQAKAPVQSDTPAASEDTQVSKLELANQLLTAGDQDLARALILSVASSAQGDIKARALQMLGQIK
jgi:pilus assembly protein FimV